MLGGLVFYPQIFQEPKRASQVEQVLMEYSKCIAVRDGSEAASRDCLCLAAGNSCVAPRLGSGALVCFSPDRAAVTQKAI